MTATNIRAALAAATLGTLLAATGLLLAGDGRSDPNRPDEPKPKSAPPIPEKGSEPKNQTDKAILTLDGHQYGAQVIELIEGGKSVLTTDLKGIARITDAATGREQRSFRTISCFSAKLSPDGRYLAVGGWKEAALYDLKEGKELWKATWRAEGSSGQSQGIGFSADARHVVCGDLSGFLRTWEADTGKSAGEVSKKKPTLQREVALAVQPGGTLVAYGTHEFTPSPPNKIVDTFTVKLRDLKGGARRNSRSRTSRGKPSGVRSPP